MKTVRIYQTGGPEGVELRGKRRNRRPRPGQAVVEIKSIGVNYNRRFKPQGY